MKSKPKPKNRTLKIDYWLSVYFAPDSSLTVEKLCIEIYRKVDEVKLILSQDEPVEVLKEKIKMLKYSNSAFCLQNYGNNKKNYSQKYKERYKKSKNGIVRPYNIRKNKPYNIRKKKEDYQKNYYIEKTVIKRQQAKINQTLEKLMVNVNSYDTKIAKLITNKGLTVNEIAKNLNMDKANLYCKIKKVPELYQKLVKPVNKIAKSEFDAIKELKKQGQTYQTIANKYNCTIRTIEKIVKGLTKS